ncbi:Uncharacterised protein [Pseudomonas aeruginosa]|nr:Uncharacterised protein [Pseudomonas aeruginosa]
MSKQQCDARLQADIAAQNGNSRLCRAVGGVYRVFVKHLGKVRSMAGRHWTST